MPIIEPVPWEDLDPELREQIEDGQRVGMLSTPVPDQIFAYRPELAKLHIARYHEIFSNGILEPRLLELVRLKIASLNRCEPCGLARKTESVSEDDIVCLNTGDDASLSDRERLAVRFGELFAVDHLSITRETYAELGEHFTKPEIVELALFVAGAVGGGRLVHTLDVFDERGEEPVLHYEGECAKSTAEA